VLQYDFEVAKDKVLMGVERKSLLLTDEEKKTRRITKPGTRSSRRSCRMPIGAPKLRSFRAVWRSA